MEAIRHADSAAVQSDFETSITYQSVPGNLRKVLTSRKTNEGSGKNGNPEGTVDVMINNGTDSSLNGSLRITTGQEEQEESSTPTAACIPSRNPDTPSFNLVPPISLYESMRSTGGRSTSTYDSTPMSASAMLAAMTQPSSPGATEYIITSSITPLGSSYEGMADHISGPDTPDTTTTTVVGDVEVVKAAAPELAGLKSVKSNIAGGYQLVPIVPANSVMTSLDDESSVSAPETPADSAADTPVNLRDNKLLNTRFALSSTRSSSARSSSVAPTTYTGSSEIEVADDDDGIAVQAVIANGTTLTGTHGCYEDDDDLAVPAKFVSPKKIKGVYSPEQRRSSSGVGYPEQRRSSSGTNGNHRTSTGRSDSTPALPAHCVESTFEHGIRSQSTTSTVTAPSGNQKIMAKHSVAISPMKPATSRPHAVTAGVQTEQYVVSARSVSIGSPQASSVINKYEEIQPVHDHVGIPLKSCPTTPATKAGSSPPPNTPAAIAASKAAAIQLHNMMRAARYNEPVPIAPLMPISDASQAQVTLLALNENLPVAMNRPVWCLDDYVVEDKLHAGTATIYKARCKLSKAAVVLKIYDLKMVSPLKKYQVLREVSLHASLKHENIVALYAAFQEGNKVCLVQEYVNGGNLNRISAKYRDQLSEPVIVQMIVDPLLKVLYNMHRVGIIHRDIKPESILFTKDHVMKLCGFGSAIDLNQEKAVSSAGTLAYMAPEVLACPAKTRPEENKMETRLHYDSACDIWAVGVTTFEVLAGFPAFAAQTPYDMEIQIATVTPKLPIRISREGRHFVQCCMTKDPRDRPNIVSLLRHIWLEACRPEAVRYREQREQREKERERERERRRTSETAEAEEIQRPPRYPHVPPSTAPSYMSYSSGAMHPSMGHMAMMPGAGSMPMMMMPVPMPNMQTMGMMPMMANGMPLGAGPAAGMQLVPVPTPMHHPMMHAMQMMPPGMHIVPVSAHRRSSSGAPLPPQKQDSGKGSKRSSRTNA